MPCVCEIPFVDELGYCYGCGGYVDEDFWEDDDDDYYKDDDDDW